MMRYLIQCRNRIFVTELAAGGTNNGIEVVFKNWALFTHYISKINNPQVDNTKEIDAVMPMYHLI